MMKLAIIITSLLTITSLYGCSDADLKGGQTGVGTSKSNEDSGDDDQSQDNLGANSDSGLDKEGKSDGDDAFDASIFSDDEIIKLCNSSAIKTKSYSVVFAPDTTECKWGADGNRPKGEGNTINAEESHYEVIKDDEWKMVCSLALSMNGNGFADDELALTLDGLLFAASWNSLPWYKNFGFESQKALLKYDRTKVIGKSWQDFDTPNPDCAEGVTCDFSKFTQSSNGLQGGTFTVNTTDEFLLNLPRDSLAKNEHTLGIHTTGQGSSSDCTHTGFDFNVKIVFVPN